MDCYGVSHGIIHWMLSLQLGVALFGVRTTPSPERYDERWLLRVSLHVFTYFRSCRLLVEGASPQVPYVLQRVGQMPLHHKWKETAVRVAPPYPLEEKKFPLSLCLWSSAPPLPHSQKVIDVCLSFHILLVTTSLKRQFCYWCFIPPASEFPREKRWKGKSRQLYFVFFSI